MENFKNLSVIIAARNEGKNIEPLLNSMELINYPKDNFEVIIIDDCSDDHTFDIASSFNSSNFTLKVLSAGAKIYPGKKGALELAISNSSFDNIVITDADCRPSPDWLKIYSDYFNKGYDFLFGPAPFYMNDKLVNIISCFENLRSTLLSAAFTKIGLPYTASARNMGFTKEAFNKMGGYRNTTETLSGDDDLLLREAVKIKLNIGYIDNIDAAVYSFTKNTIKEYFIQKKRHTKTSVHYLMIHKVLLGLWHMLNLFLLFAPLIFLNSLAGPIMITAKILFDIILVKTTEKKLNYKFPIMHIPTLQVIYEVMLPINFISALLGKDKWK